jgi:hypothetical protein
MPIIEDEHEEVALKYFKKHNIDIYGEYFESTRRRARLRKNFGRSGSANNVHDDENGEIYDSRRD